MLLSSSFSISFLHTRSPAAFPHGRFQKTYSWGSYDCSCPLSDIAATSFQKKPQAFNTCSRIKIQLYLPCSVNLPAWPFAWPALESRLFEKKISARRDSNPRPSPWQGDAPPLSHSRILLFPVDLDCLPWTKWMILQCPEFVNGSIVLFFPTFSEINW